MTQDIKEQIRDRYIAEYIADAGAKKPGILGKIWRNARSIKEHLDVLKKAEPQAHALVYVIGAVLLLSGMGGAPVFTAVVIAAGAGYVGGLIRANCEVRSEASAAIARDIEDGKLGARFKAETSAKIPPDAQLSKLPAGGLAAAQFTACAECAAPEAESLPPARGIERPHGRHFG